MCVCVCVAGVGWGCSCNVLCNILTPPPTRTHIFENNSTRHNLILKQYRISMLFIFSHLTYLAFLLTLFHIINIIYNNYIMKQYILIG